MGTLIEYVQAALPACMTFGPAFLVMDGKDARRTRILRYLGAIMVCGALMMQWFDIESQKRQMEALKNRIDHMNSSVR